MERGRRELRLTLAIVLLGAAGGSGNRWPRGWGSREDREHLASGIDAASGLTVHSLDTSTTGAPPDSTLRDLHVLVVDLQDIGTRTWTYVGSMRYAMRAARGGSFRSSCWIAPTLSPDSTSTVRCSSRRWHMPRKMRPVALAARTHYIPRPCATE